MTGDKLREFADICTEKKISQLKLADGTCICMHDFAFYENKLGPNNAGQADFPTINELDDDKIDEDILFHSAR